MRGAQGDGLLEIVAHAHRQALQPVARSNFCKQRKMQRGRFIDRRNAHQPRHGQIHAAAFRDKGIGLGRGDTGLLRLFSGVHLNIQLRAMPHLLGDAGDSMGQFGPVHRMDVLKQAKSLTHLVGLQRANQMQINIAIVCAKIGPFSGGLLHLVFTKHPLALI